MREWARSLFLLSLGSLLALALVGSRPLEKRWYKGNTHAHTLWSDGDAAPEAVADWYKSRGYHFLVLSDHNIVLEGERWVRIGNEKREFPPERVAKLVKAYGKESVVLRGAEMRLQTLAELRRRFEEKERFLLVAGEEITDEKFHVHHNTVNHAGLIAPPTGRSAREIMEKTLAAVKAAAGDRPVLVHLNHPNWKWAVTPDDVAHVLGERYFEVYNGSRDTANYGDAAHMGLEPMWDYVLTLRLSKLGGEVLYGLATDDAHEYFREPATSNPGRGWVMVRAEALTADAIARAMLAGDFYASSGVTLEEVSAGRDGLALKIAAQEGVAYTTRFIGKWDPKKKAGELLAEAKGASASYRFRGDELYVRAVVVSSRKHPNGYDKDDVETAWTRPVVRKP